MRMFILSAMGLASLVFLFVSDARSESAPLCRSSKSITNIGRGNTTLAATNSAFSAAAKYVRQACGGKVLVTDVVSEPKGNSAILTNLKAARYLAKVTTTFCCAQDDLINISVPEPEHSYLARPLSCERSADLDTIAGRGSKNTVTAVKSGSARLAKALSNKCGLGAQMELSRLNYGVRYNSSNQTYRVAIDASLCCVKKSDQRTRFTYVPGGFGDYLRYGPEGPSETYLRDSTGDYLLTPEEISIDKGRLVIPFRRKVWHPYPSGADSNFGPVLFALKPRERNIFKLLIVDDMLRYARQPYTPSRTTLTGLRKVLQTRAELGEVFQEVAEFFSLSIPAGSFPAYASPKGPLDLQPDQDGIWSGFHLPQYVMGYETAQGQLFAFPDKQVLFIDESGSVGLLTATEFRKVVAARGTDHLYANSVENFIGFTIVGFSGAEHPATQPVGVDPTISVLKDLGGMALAERQAYLAEGARLLKANTRINIYK